MILTRETDRAIGRQLTEQLAEVECRFAAELISDLPAVNGLVEHIEQYRGKMLRPMLVLVTAMATGRQEPSVTDAHRVVATVMEMVHMATLVHDDVLDEAEIRRQGVTVNSLSGNETAVMLGDYLISHAYHLCSSLDVSNDDVSRLSDDGSPIVVSRIVADATNTVCEGELLQLTNRNNWALDEGTYFEIIRRKTASLCGVCCRLAAILNDADEATVEAVDQFGQKLGVAFQIVDDLLDVVGDEETVGKTLGRDLQKGKLTLPMIHCLSQLGTDERDRFIGWLNVGLARSNGVDPIQVIRRRLLEGGSVDYARDWAMRLVEQAKESLNELPDSPARSTLLQMADAVINRKS